MHLIELGYPFLSFVVTVQNSLGYNSTNNLTITGNINCSPGLDNNIWSTQGSVCNSCPTGGLCSNVGLFNVTNAAGYYALGNNIFVPCFPAEGCPQNMAYLNGSYVCGTGYQGLRCGVCEEGYYKSGNYCAACPTYTTPVPLLIFLGVIVISALLFIAYKLKDYDMAFVTVASTFLQAVGTFYSLKLQWPAEILDLLNSLSFMNLNIQIISPECLSLTSSKSSFEFGFYSTLGLPLAIAGAALVVFLALKSGLVNFLLANTIQRMNALRVVQSMQRRIPKSRRKPGKISMELGGEGTLVSSLIAAVLLSFQFLYLTLATTALSIFNCTYNSDTQSYYFEIAANRLCYTQDWWWAVLPYSLSALAVYVFGTLTVTHYLQYKRREILKRYPITDWEHLVINITYKSFPLYRPGLLFWETFIMLRKLGIAASLMFLSHHPGLQGVSLILIFLVSLILQYRNNPYNSPSINDLEEITLIASILLVLAGILSYVGQLESPSYFTAISYGMIGTLLITGFLMAYGLFLHINPWKIDRSEGKETSSSKRKSHQHHRDPKVEKSREYVSNSSVSSSQKPSLIHLRDVSSVGLLSPNSTRPSPLSRSADSSISTGSAIGSPIPVRKK